jgi:predicted DNA-binding transcriptional regulator YafY
VTLTFQVDGLNEILHWVLGWSGRARVVKPPELRALVVEQLRAALRLNGG